MKTITFEGVQYVCGNCDHKATTLDSINKHEESTHEDFSRLLKKTHLSVGHICCDCEY